MNVPDDMKPYPLPTGAKQAVKKLNEKQPCHWLIKMNGEVMTFIGGQCVKAKEPGYVWLCDLNGERKFRVKRKFVSVSSPERTAALMATQPDPSMN